MMNSHPVLTGLSPCTCRAIFQPFALSKEEDHCSSFRKKHNEFWVPGLEAELNSLTIFGSIEATIGLISIPLLDALVPLIEEIL